MPDRNPRPCPKWPCAQYRPCPIHDRYRHDRDAERERNERRSTAAKIYSSGRWKQLRRRTLLERPWCVWPGCHLPAVEVDHVTPLQDGGDPWDETNLQPLCVGHHHRKTADDVAARRRTRKGNRT